MIPLVKTFLPPKEILIPELEKILNDRRRQIEKKQERKNNLLRQVSKVVAEIEAIQGLNTPSPTDTVVQSRTSGKSSRWSKKRGRKLTMPRIAADIFRKVGNRPMRAKDVRDCMVGLKVLTTKNKKKFHNAVATLLGRHKWFVRIKKGVYRLGLKYA